MVEQRLSRRAFVRGAAATFAAPGIVGCVSTTRSWANDPFSLGVAAGSPSADGFVLWTRLAPEPSNYDPTATAGMSGDGVTVAYEIATDPSLRTIIARGTAFADPRYGYSVHVEITGLQPGRPYWYRFMSGDATSRIGRAMTRPPQGAPVERVNFGFVSCSNYEHGYFSAYRHLADEQPDFVLFLGDYIYEYPETRVNDLVRRHSEGVETTSLAAYRNRYAQYRTDPDLQRLHAETTAMMTWDDHEVQNDYADQWSQSFDDPQRFLMRRAAAYQAYYEHMPVRAMSRPNGPMMRLYDRFGFGDLLEISLIDGRQYRSRGACYGPPDKGRGHVETIASCPERLEEGRTMLGAQQESWLFDGFAKSSARWNVLAGDVMISQWKQRTMAGEPAFWTDDWNGYPAARTRLLDRIRDTGLSNPVTVCGDVHAYYANDLKLDFDDPSSSTIATEFVGTSVSARPAPYEAFAPFLPANPHVKFFESRQRGYVSVALTRQSMTTRFRAVSNVMDSNATVATLRTFVVEDGRPGAVDT
jgi:alkaline phosphatase D